MSPPVTARIGASVGAAWSSLEKRLSGALLLIALCAVVLQIISQDRAFQLRGESAALTSAAENAEHARQLSGAVSKFRLAASLYLAERERDPAAADPLTDSAIEIGEQVNALRLGGAALYDLPTDVAIFDDIDETLSRIVDAGQGVSIPPAKLRVIEQRNEAMAASAALIERTFAERRDAAFARLGKSTRNWHLVISLVGGATIALVLLILLDLMRNILPSLRRMHRALRGLAEGDLDFEIGRFDLTELQELSGSLETFRRNALAVRDLAYTDPATGLPNRRAFLERAGALLAGESEGGSGSGSHSFAIMVADIDRFKLVNDEYGHAAGDRLVAQIGRRIGEILGEEAIIARVGGDEFAICVPLLGDRGAAAIASELVSWIRQPFEMGNFTLSVNLSIGVVEARGGPDAGDVTPWLNKADLALYAAKNAGRNRAMAYVRELEEDREVERALERDLAHAIERQQVRILYQPIHPLDSGGNEVEALVRWHHPALGEIAPARFIPAAERSGHMVPLGNWIIEQATRDLAQWPDLAMSINLSPVQLQQEGFVPFLIKCCRRHAIVPRRIILEVTESLSIEHNSRALTTLEVLRGAGFRIALDDFGTGYSSLCLMKTFRFDRLKLDRTLISGLDEDPTARAVFEAAVTMALRVGAEVVAEGISEERLVEPVRSAGCTHLQGFHYSCPIEAHQIADYFRSAPSLERKVA